MLPNPYELFCAFKLFLILWFQVARVRIHGFSEREISVVRALLMSEIESAYLERDQMQSTSLRDEFLQVLLITSLFFSLVALLQTFLVGEYQVYIKLSKKLNHIHLFHNV